MKIIDILIYKQNIVKTYKQNNDLFNKINHRSSLTPTLHMLLKLYCLY